VSEFAFYYLIHNKLEEALAATRMHAFIFSRLISSDSPFHSRGPNRRFHEYNELPQHIGYEGIIATYIWLLERELEFYEYDSMLALPTPQIIC